MNNPTKQMIRTKVESILRSAPNAEIIGIRCSSNHIDDPTIDIKAGSLPLHQCRSVLHIREVLSENKANCIVIMTELDDKELGNELLSRFSGRRLHSLNPWEILKEHFDAVTVDSTLARHKWLATTLIDNMPVGGYDPPPGLVLDADTVWQIGLKAKFGIDDARPGVITLLEWASDKSLLCKYLDTTDEVKDGFRDRIRLSAGNTGELILNAIDAGYGEYLTAIGLVCEIIFNREVNDHTLIDLNKAAVRLERFVGDNPISKQQAEIWKRASVEILDTLDENKNKNNSVRESNRLLDQVDELLSKLVIDQYAYLSTKSPKGYEQALDRFGRELKQIVDEKNFVATDELRKLRDYLASHRETKKHKDRFELIDMSLRLLNRLNDAPPSTDNFAQACTNYSIDGSFADMARHMLGSGDKATMLSRAYSLIIDKTTEVRERENRRFAEMLSEWCRIGSPPLDNVLKIEEVLARIVTPVVKLSNVLVIIIDGLSYSVFRELYNDICEQGWMEISLNNQREIAVSGIPSITEVSRASLLCGKITRGTAAVEIKGFENNESLRSISKSTPILFHKNKLTESGRNEPSDEVLHEIRSTTHKIIGIVINAVDDNLAKGDQRERRWKLKSIPLLEHLLNAAKDSNRTVIITSDHGHIYETGAEYRRLDDHTGGERYKVDVNRLGEGELLVSGPRVSGNSIVLPWSEKVRYAPKKHGYHGGATPQECVVPVCVFVKDNKDLSKSMKGWNELANWTPEWWDTNATHKLHTMILAYTGHKQISEDHDVLPLWKPAISTEPESLIIRLLNSPMLKEQISMVGKAAPKKNEIELFLSILEERNGAALKSAVAQRLGYPESRMAGITAAMQRILNIDGYGVLEVDEDTVKLNIPLLKTQFDL